MKHSDYKRNKLHTGYDWKSNTILANLSDMQKDEILPYIGKIIAP